MLNVKDIAKLLSVSEKTIYRWIKDKEIPTYKVGESYKFNRVEIMEWATARKIRVSYNIFDENEDLKIKVSLLDALKNGGIHYRISGKDRESVIRTIVEIINLPEDVDREFLCNALIARENMGTTAIGDGFAIPHVRNPVIFHITKPIVALCFLEESIDFGALDKKPVNTIFTLITPTIRSHLSLLSRLSFILHKPEVKKVINSSSTREEIFKVIEECEKEINNKEE